MGRLLVSAVGLKDGLIVDFTVVGGAVLGLVGTLIGVGITVGINEGGEVGCRKAINNKERCGFLSLGQNELYLRAEVGPPTGATLINVVKA